MRQASAEVPRVLRTRACVMAAAAAVAVGLGSCDAQSALPEPPAVVEARLDEYAIDHDATALDAGRVVFEARNEGEEAHELVVVPLEEDMPPLEQQLRGDERRSVGTLALLPALDPGEAGMFAVDLEAGRYGLLCFVEGPEGVPHALRGMHTEFRVE